MKTRVALLALLSSCSLAFPLEGYSRRLDGGSPDGGSTTADGGTAEQRFALLAGGNWRETLIARFDTTGVLLAIDPGPTLNDERSGLMLLDGTVVAVNNSGVARAPLVDGKPTTWAVTSASPRMYGTGELIVTPHGVLNPPGTNGNKVAAAPFLASGALGQWRDASENTTTNWIEPIGVAGSNFVLILGGAVLVNGVQTPSDTIEVASLAAGPTLGEFNDTTPLPVAVRQPAVTLAEGRLYVCGGNRNSSSSNACFSAAVNSDGTLGTFEGLPDLPSGTQRGALVKIARRLHLFTTDAPLSLDLDGAGGWVRTSLRLPAGREVGRALRLSP